MPATWSYDADGAKSRLREWGVLGVEAAYNGGELAAPYEAPASITYNVYPEEDGSLTVTILIADPGWWTFKLVRNNSF